MAYLQFIWYMHHVIIPQGSVLIASRRYFTDSWRGDRDLYKLAFGISFWPTHNLESKGSKKDILDKFRIKFSFVILVISSIIGKSIDRKSVAPHKKNNLLFVYYCCTDSYFSSIYFPFKNTQDIIVLVVRIYELFY
jgi:hypothetical protein